jgi:signal transduction histidine kinase
VESCRPLAESLDQTLTVHQPAQQLYVHADRVRLSQVFSNLLTNASKYTPRGGSITLNAARENGEAVVSVKDTGIGIAPELLPTVFEMFRQLEVPADQSLGGLGIGLTLVRRLVEMHGGRVEARSEGSGRGSEFTVRLPLDCRPAESLPAAPGRAPNGADAAARSWSSMTTAMRQKCWPAC